MKNKKPNKRQSEKELMDSMLDSIFANLAPLGIDRISFADANGKDVVEYRAKKKAKKKVKKAKKKK